MAPLLINANETFLFYFISLIFIHNLYDKREEKYRKYATCPVIKYKRKILTLTDIFKQFFYLTKETCLCLFEKWQEIFFFSLKCLDMLKDKKYV